MPDVGLDVGHGINTFPPSKGVYKNGVGYAEHDFNSKLAIEVDKLLKHNGINVIMYQKPFSKDIPLKQRTDYYNAKNVDLVYSIHANANGNTDVNGRCVFYWHTSTKGKQLANIVVDEIKKAGYSTHGNGLHPSMKGSWTNLHICRETKMPAVLVENGFMTGKEDFELIFGSKQTEYIHNMARVHAKAICRYFGKTFKDIQSKKEVVKVANKNEVSEWAKESWEVAKKLGITDGSNPQGTPTREQVVTMIVRALNLK